ncbi:unnamed protein product [Lactuca saligna]|uniref:MULE transposase domain-containing protein n=1 Tax=Lactuca saligna TaxID=75948 RepID=A0AA35Z6N6_LACSI|nr:unnamed protein product [Lactuca saligna]
MSVRMLREEVKTDFGINVSMSQCRRAKKYALSLVEGTITENYAKLWSYGEEIRRSNPGSTVKICVDSMSDGKNYFSKIYICFASVKKGWRGGCKRIINLDGCFRKTFCQGELLCTVGRDANNEIFPIALAVVSVENRENWKWFLETLSEDLQCWNDGNGLINTRYGSKLLHVLNLVIAIRISNINESVNVATGVGDDEVIVDATDALDRPRDEERMVGVNGGEEEVNFNAQVKHVKPPIMRKKSERIIKIKLAKNVGSEGSSVATAMDLD